MSDNWIALIPKDPRFVPDAAKRRQARDRFAEIAPKQTRSKPQFQDDGYKREFEEILGTELRVIYQRV